MLCLYVLCLKTCHVIGNLITFPMMYNLNDTSIYNMNVSLYYINIYGVWNIAI